jgi:hypothetical protein
MFSLEWVMKAQRGSTGIALLFLEPWQYMREGGQLHAPTALPPGKRPGTHCIGDWVGPRACLDGCGKSRPTGIRSPERPAVMSCYTAYTIPADEVDKDATSMGFRMAVSCIG